VVGDRWLGESHRVGQLTNACFAVFMRCHEGQQPQSSWIRYGLEYECQRLGLIFVKGLTNQWRAAVRGIKDWQRGGRTHTRSMPQRIDSCRCPAPQSSIDKYLWTGSTAMTNDMRMQVRDRYAAAATEAVNSERSECCEAGCGCGEAWYSPDELRTLPHEAAAASLGCGNPVAVADLRPGDRVLDLGSGGGIDVLLSARRVGPTGKAYGLDMTPEMLALARGNAARAGVANVEFLRGHIEDVPLPDHSVDVVISNCVVNLSTDKSAVLWEMFRVLAPGGRIAISDIVAEDHLTVEERSNRGSYVGCIAGALSRAEYLDGLATAGFVDASVDFTYEAAPNMHGAIIRATKPAARA
jgi:arsenite methyltransferase